MSSNLSKQRYCRYDGTSMQPESPKNRRRGESCRLELTHAPDARQRPGGMITSSFMLGRSGVGGGCAGLQQFWCVEKPVKFPEHPWRNRAQHLTPFFQTKNTHEDRYSFVFCFFLRHTKCFSWFLWEKICHTKTSRASFGKLGPKHFAPRKICLLAHLRLFVTWCGANKTNKGVVRCFETS